MAKGNHKPERERMTSGRIQRKEINDERRVSNGRSPSGRVRAMCAAILLPHHPYRQMMQLPLRDYPYV